MIEPWSKHYSPELCPEYWEILKSLAESGVIFCTMEVKREIQNKTDRLSEWAAKCPQLFREVSDEVNQNMRRIMSSHSQLVDDKKGRSLADPWVVAHAMAEGATVVTTEMPAPRKIKIPDVCDAYKVRWIPESTFALEIGIKFTARLS